MILKKIFVEAMEEQAHLDDLDLILAWYLGREVERFIVYHHGTSMFSSISRYGKFESYLLIITEKHECHGFTCIWTRQKIEGMIAFLANVAVFSEKMQEILEYLKKLRKKEQYGGMIDFIEIKYQQADETDEILRELGENLEMRCARCFDAFIKIYRYILNIPNDTPIIYSVGEKIFRHLPPP